HHSVAPVAITAQEGFVQVAGMTRQFYRLPGNRPQPGFEKIVLPHPGWIRDAAEPVVAGKTKRFLAATHPAAMHVEETSLLARSLDTPDQRPGLPYLAKIRARLVSTQQAEKDRAHGDKNADVLMGIDQPRPMANQRSVPCELSLKLGGNLVAANAA